MISLRDVLLSDIDNLHKSANMIEAGQYMSRYLPSGNTYEQMLENTLAWKIIEVDSEAAGVIWLDRTDKPECTVLGMMLFSSNYFSKGIGSSSIQLLFSYLKAQKWFGTVYLNVRDANQRAISCYKRVGFQQIGVGIKTQGHSEIRYIKMRVILAR
ncbi:GNAT family N-acetyltransferase [Vibrio tritonius]|uniref:GNAT family N-acetyltransferase n=1 Tax=Vibrio tritonius TaxID=1435069 RepID=UPI000838BD6B|nr:GNAT family N-acetyltransferase [Vibrio tritonius]